MDMFLPVILRKVKPVELERQDKRICTRLEEWQCNYRRKALRRYHISSEELMSTIHSLRSTDPHYSKAIPIKLDYER